MLKKIDDTHVSNVATIVNKIYMQRHKLKMIWFAINKEEDERTDLASRDGDRDDGTDEGREETKEEELTEEQKYELEQKELQRKTRLRELARMRTEQLEGYIDRLNLDSKSKTRLMNPVRATRDFRVTSKLENFFHIIICDLPKELAEALLKKPTGKISQKKMQELIDRDAERDRIYFDYLRTQVNRRHQN